MPGRFAAGHFFFRHRASGGRGPPCAARWGRALLTRRFTFVDGSSTRPAPPPHPSFAALTTGGPPPPRSRGRKAKPPVLAARFFCTRVMRHAISKNDAGNPTFVRCPRQWKSPDASRSEAAKAVARMSEAKSGDDLAAFTAAPRVSLRSTRATKSFQTRFLQQKGSRTPTDAGLPASPSGEARTLARARSPVGVPLRLSPGRQLVPKAQRQAMLSGTVRSVRSCTAAPTGERRPCASPCMIRKRECRFSGRIMHHSRALPAPKQIPVQ